MTMMRKIWKIEIINVYSKLSSISTCVKYATVISDGKCTITCPNHLTSLTLPFHPIPPPHYRYL
jgi:hypothetical protein